MTTVYRDTGGANGLAFGPDGALYACAGKARAIVRYGPAGEKTVLADRFEGARLNSPNDLVLDAAGDVWFTDPRYGDDGSDRELDHDSVYRLTPPRDGADSWSIRRLTVDTTRPNGLLLAADERTLYLAQSDYDPGSVRQLRCCGWELSGPGSRVAVFAPDGTVRGEHPVPAGRPTNCAFGGADLADLYLTTLDGRLYRVRDTGRRGHLRPLRVPLHLPG